MFFPRIHKFKYPGVKREKICNVVDLRFTIGYKESYVSKFKTRRGGKVGGGG